MARQKVSMLAYAVPFMGFMLAGWYGLATVVQSKRDIRGATRGLDMLEEMDPLERMRQRYNLDSSRGGTAASSAPKISSLEEELEELQRKVNIKDFDYVAVPRTDDDA